MYKYVRYMSVNQTKKQRLLRYLNLVNHTTCSYIPTAISAFPGRIESVVQHTNNKHF